MNPLDNRYERNPALHRDMPENLFEDQGEMRVIFYGTDNSIYPFGLPYKINGIELEVDCSQVKDVWEESMRDDLNLAIDRKFGSFFLSRKDLNLNIIGL